MIVAMQTERLETLEQVRGLLEGNAAVEYQLAERGSAYRFVRRTLAQFGYHGLGKAEKGLVRRYMGKVTGMSRAQMTRLIRQHRETGRVEDGRGKAPAVPFERRYRKTDIELLAQVDTALGQMSGPATRALMRRQYELFGDRRFERLAGISNGHLYNLRHSLSYRRRRTTLTHTRPTPVAIGERRRPCPDGRPGYIRVDTVHQGDRDGHKGVYHVNLVDEVTQWQHVGCVEAISERFLVPVLEALLQSYPFVVQGFHSDNGSEYINHRVANLLNKLHIGQFTKGRSRRTNDNALVEGKNAAVVRKYLGYAHIPKRFASQVNAFTQDVLSPFLNYHRPCLYPVDIPDAKGRIKKRYPHDPVTTPYEKLKSLPDSAQFLRPGLSFAQLDATAYAASDLQAAHALNQARDQLFRLIHRLSAPSVA
ncbi:MAG: integrase [Deltaproteobacteria bacterium]|nr:integrase [Deltaproteobacteria bacterium]